MLPVKVPPSRLRIAESSLGGWGYGFGPISRPWVCWSKVGTPTWRQPPKHPRPPREVHVCALPPEGPGTVRWIAGRYCPPPFHTQCWAKDHGGGRCFPNSSPRRAFTACPATAGGGGRRRNAKRVTPSTQARAIGTWRSTDSPGGGSQRGGLKKKQEASWRTDGWLKSVLPLSSLCVSACVRVCVCERERERERENAVLLWKARVKIS